MGRVKWAEEAGSGTVSALWGAPSETPCVLSPPCTLRRWIEAIADVSPTTLDGMPHTYEEAGEGDEVQIPGGHRTLVGGCVGICWACACTRIGSFGAHWRGAGDGDHRPGRDAATRRSCGAQGALRPEKARETGGWRTGADGGAGAETPA